MLTAAELGMYSYFASMSENAREELAKKLERIEVSAGETIIKQGTPPDYYYFIVDGELEVTKRTRFGQDALLSVLNNGQNFGETALLTCSHRTSSVTAKTDSILYRLNKKDFEDLILMDSSFKNAQLKNQSSYSTFNKMKTYQPFAQLPPEKMILLEEGLKEECYGPGGVIIKQGDPQGPFYIVKSGCVEVVKEKDGKESVIAKLCEGDSFGEEAIIRDQGRNATVRATEDTVVMVLDKKNFNKILFSTYLDNAFPEDYEPEDYSKYVFIDARVPPEYEEEHIEAAVNIPIEILRAKYPELDKKQEYLTYCTNDSRGMAAAFLLNMNGFNAKCIRGGLSGWTGPTTSNTDGMGVHLPSS